ncbi:hypothetical protein TcWFU_008396 [Taenia crassiceps]|uniref:Zinc finger RING-type eukaryotic domain-containing protein n=1 Tax=Taenia crassiceps TaxID=6207 RepID=A0ABR4Q1R1_9CEST
MNSTDEDLICGVCQNLMNDPHRLPCGHTFCLRPCLLSRAGATSVRCIQCQVTFDVTDLSRKVYVAEPFRMGWRRIAVCGPKQTQQINCRQESEQDPLQKRQYCLTLRTKLNSLCRQKTLLISQKSKFLKTTEIIEALNAADMQLREAADAILNAALTKLEELDKDSCGSIYKLIQRISKLSIKVGGTQDIKQSLKWARDMQAALTYQKKLYSLIREAGALKVAIENLIPLPITQMQASDRIAKISEYLSDFNFIISDGVIPLPVPPRNDNQDKRQVAT